MKAAEFKDWLDVWMHTDDEEGELAMRALVAHVENLEAARGLGDIEDAAREFGDRISTGIAWASFWPSLAAVLCVAIWRLA